MGLLLEARADINLADSKGSTALMIASWQGRVEVVRLLLEAGASKDLAGISISTAFQDRIGSTSRRSSALAAGGPCQHKLGRPRRLHSFDIRSCTRSYRSRALAAIGGPCRQQRVRRPWLDSFDDRISISTAFKIASGQRHVEVLRLLLVARANTNLVDHDAFTALTSAAAQGHIEVARLLLLEAHADSNASDGRGWTALTTASRHGHVDVVGLLLEAGADTKLGRQQGCHSFDDRISARP